MWPARWAVSVMPGGAMTSPLNSAGERTSTRAKLGVARGAAGCRRGRRAARSRARAAGSRSPRSDGTSVDERQAVVEPVLAAAVEDPDVAVAEQLQLPVGPGREPVVVVAVQDDRRVGADAGLAQSSFAEVLAAGDVAADAVGELAGPVPADGARAGGSARRRSCRRRPRRSGRSGRRGGPWPSRRRRGRRWRSRGRSWGGSLETPAVWRDGGAAGRRSSGDRARRRQRQDRAR